MSTNKSANLMRPSVIVLSIACVTLGVLASCSGAEDGYEQTHPGALRDPADQCKPSTRIFRASSEGPTTAVYPNQTQWCAIWEADDHMYCFDEGQAYVVLKLVHDGELTAVPAGHPDLACWQAEVIVWGGVGKGALTPSPGVTLPI